MMRLKPNPSRRVKSATVAAASSERPNESSSAESVVHLMKRPPVLHSRAATTTRKSGDEPLRAGREFAARCFDNGAFSNYDSFSTLPPVPFWARRNLPKTRFQGGMTMETAPVACA